MQGVEILTSTEVLVERAFNWTTFWIACGVVLGLCIIAGIISAVVEGDLLLDIMPISCIIGVILGILIGVVFGYAYSTHITYETLYKVTISDQVPMAEFLEHYEVIDQDGKIFTVREKTNESN